MKQSFRFSVGKIHQMNNPTRTAPAITQSDGPHDHTIAGIDGVDMMRGWGDGPVERAIVMRLLRRGRQSLPGVHLSPPRKSPRGRWVAIMRATEPRLPALVSKQVNAYSIGPLPYAGQGG